MTELSRLHAAADATLAIEQALRAGDYWHQDVPTPAAMASRTPFCADTLSFTQWLQFILLPRMRTLIEQNQPLPTSSGIAVMAEQELAETPGRETLIQRLADFDALIERLGAGR